MSKIKSWMLNNIWWLHVVAVWAILSLVYHVHYETCDDDYMAAIANGVFGQYDYHVVFQNVLLGKWYVFLNKLCPVVNWYTWTQIVVLILSFSGVALILIKKYGTKLGMLASTVVQILFWYQCFVLMQFTKTAGIAVASGVILITYEMLLDEETSFPTVGLGAILVLVGSMLRMDILYAELLVMAPPIIMVVIVRKESRTKKRGCCLLGGGALLCGVAVGLNFYSQKQYTGDWADYLKHQEKVSAVMDYGFPYYYDAPEVFDSIGISEEDLEYYRSWNTADQEKLNDEALDKIKIVSDGYWVPVKEKVRNFVPLFFNKIWKVSVFPSLCIALLIPFLFGNLRSKVTCLLELILLLSVYFYLYYQGRVFINRVDVAICWGACLVLWILFESNKKGKIFPIQQLLFGCVIVEVIYGGFQFRGNMMISSIREQVLSQKNFLTEIAADKDHIYLGTNASIPFGCRMYTREAEGAYRNLYNMGSWTVGTPVTDGVLADYEIQNPYRDVINNEKAFYISGLYYEETYTYLQSYQKNVHLVKEIEIDGHEVYRVVAIEEQEKEGNDD